MRGQGVLAEAQFAHSRRRPLLSLAFLLTTVRLNARALALIYRRRERQGSLAAMDQAQMAQRNSGQVQRFVMLRFLFSTHFLNDAKLSPDGLPANRFSTLISSSRDSQ